jgi:hypothetical protein
MLALHASTVPLTHAVARSRPCGFALAVTHPASTASVRHVARPCCTETVYNKRMCQVFLMFQTYVASVS